MADKDAGGRTWSEEGGRDYSNEGGRDWGQEGTTEETVVRGNEHVVHLVLLGVG